MAEHKALCKQLRESNMAREKYGGPSYDAYKRHSNFLKLITANVQDASGSLKDT